MKPRVIIEWIAGFAILAGFLVGLLLVIALPFEIAHMANVLEWPTREGTITHSRPSWSYQQSNGSRSIRGISHKRWHADIRGTFDDTGELFRITEFGKERLTLGGRETQSQDIAARYPVGAKALVYYSPAAPAKAVLEPADPWATPFYAFLMGCGLVLLPFGLFFAGRMAGWKGYQSVSV